MTSIDRVEQLFDGLLDKGAPGFHRLRRKVAMDHPAHLQMLRTVVLNELVALVVPDIVVEAHVRLVDRRIGRPRVVLEDGRRKQLVVPGQPDQLVIPGDDP
jgi:hypothetical protein